jgi:hypothetical protein
VDSDRACLHNIVEVLQRLFGEEGLQNMLADAIAGTIGEARKTLDGRMVGGSRHIYG